MAEPRQKFYTKPMKKGCCIVAFYNYCRREFSEQERARMIAFATEHYSDLPWQASPDSKVPYGVLIVWVDITDDALSIGIALAGDQARIGHNKWKKSDCTKNDITDPGFICSCLRQYAEGWLAREGNISNPKEVERKLRRLQKK